MKALGFGVLILPDPVEERLKKKDSMIVIPETVIDKQRLEISTGTIVAIGDAAWKDLADGKPWAKIGDRVIYAKYGGKLFKHPKTNVDYVLVQDRDILLKLEEEDEVETYDD